MSDDTVFFMSNVTLTKRRCYACGNWWAVETRVSTDTCKCPVCAGNTIEAADAARKGLQRRLNAQKAATERMRSRRGTGRGS